MSHERVKLSQEVVALVEESELCSHVGEELEEGGRGGREGGGEGGREGGGREGGREGGR